MAPARPLKRQKTNPDSGPPGEIPAHEVPLPRESSQPKLLDKPDVPDGEERRSSWYSRSWQRKTAPITELVRESIPSDGASIKTASVRSTGKKERTGSVSSPSLAKSFGRNGSYRSLPADTETTKIHATPRASISSNNELPLEATSTKSKPENSADVHPKSTEVKRDVRPNEETSGSSSTTKPANTSIANLNEDSSESRLSWLGWLAKYDAATNKPEMTKISTDEGSQVGNQSPLPPTNSEAEKKEKPVLKPSEEGNLPKTSNNKRNWLQMWSNDPNAKLRTVTEVQDSENSPDHLTNGKAPDATTASDTKSNPKVSSESQGLSMETSPPPELPGDSSKSAGWVFWSRDRKLNNGSTDQGDAHIGEIAISDTPTQTKPKRASISLKDEQPKPDLKLKQQTESSSLNLMPAETPKSQDTDSIRESKVIKKTELKKDPLGKKVDAKGTAVMPQKLEETGSPRPVSPAPLKKVQENLLLPSFRDTISLPDNPSILQQLARLLYYTKEPEFKHLSRIRNPPKIKNALAIGVHGFFPTPMVRTVIGQPTGTSIRFADMASKAIKRWTKNQGYECEVKTAALEGEGKIAERIEVLWRLLLNFIDEIRKSDFILVAAHSQGVPVAVMLVAKLIQFGCVNSAQVGIVAMAGVNMGPFQTLKSRWISGSASELFEFGEPTSKVSLDYLAALEVVLRFGVRVSFIGSIDDQLVSLESSIFATVTHPHIYRAVLIDSRLHAPNFLSHLVGFALKLRNLGVRDHGLIRELSSPLAGSLYTGEGHSRLYEDDAVYDLAVSFALETTALANVPIAQSPSLAGGTGNPYILPFAMRGILEEDFVKNELQGEANELLKQFDDWKPTTKVLKDVKFRLEGIRSKL